MHARWAIAVLIVLLPPASWAQMRGSGRGSVSIGRPAFAARGPAVASRGRVFVGSNRGVVFRSGFGRRFHHHRFFVGVPWGFYGYPGWYNADYAYSQDIYSSRESSEYSALYQQNQELAREIDRLSDEVERLRDEQSRYAAPAPAPKTQAQSKPEAHEPTVLVFRDKHKQEVENYAIVGQTLWIFSEQRATKSPLSSLDVDATSRANDERGLEFRVPQ
ncbi:MAG: hypothetical protein DMG88_09100 [Acidobacteria bacterium]|nr:MAG: hypothetical protein DMG88_09100 [Acidobacteriota bacterium]